MKKVLITGSLGYLGSALLPYLQAKGYQCIGYDTGFFRDALLYEPAPTDTVLKDVRDITEADLEGIDVVVHLAGISNDPLKELDAARVYGPTRVYSLNLAKLCKQKGIKFIFPSSCSVYGIGQSELLTELSPVHPQTPYSLNKLQIEEDLRSISDQNFSPIALRFATVFGPSPRLRFDLVLNMFAGMAVANGQLVLNSDGQAWRPNLYITDFCQAIWRAIELDYHQGELLILNVGDESNNRQVIELAKIVQATVPGCDLKFLSQNPELDQAGLIRDRKVKEVDTRTYRVSFAKIREVIPEFKCEWTVERGVADLVALLRKLPLTEEIFKRTGFYRLQQLEYLHEYQYLSDDLRWLKDRPLLPASISQI
jgi:nucleoside-diphosphate-sugar epimerase